MEQATREPLDNVVWHALRGPHDTLAEGVGSATRYRSSIAPFAALPDDMSNGAWSDLGALVGPGNMAVLFRDRVDAPEGWGEVDRLPTLQMLATNVDAELVENAQVLGPADVDEMIDLVARTEPGPFARDTITLGTYVGVRDGGRLIAMAGERVRTESHTEISAICTDPDHRGRGLAGMLTRHMVALIRDRRQVPFLHVLLDNVSALTLYRSLGFVERRETVVSIVTAPA